MKPRRYDQMSPEDQRIVDERDLKILRLNDLGLSQSEIGRRLGVAQATVWRVLRDMEEHL